ncbi:MAG: Xaa-Pro peptidase family protein [Nitriliruptorales bacterium]|nr:Xaa-Pro peptidase family protein [Nitriliruptorales bacterium]
MGGSAHTERLERVRDAMAADGVEALLLGPGANLRWLAGYHALPLERLTLLVVPVAGDPALVVPELEAARAQASPAIGIAHLLTWGETDDPDAIVADLVPAADRVAVDDRLWTSFTLRLQRRLEVGRWTVASDLLGPLRQVKDEAELGALAAAGAAIDHVHERVPSLLRAGRTEREVAADIAAEIRATHDEVAFVIVASGPNGASAHHEPDDRRLEVGDAVIVDIGGILDAYCSDETRNYHLGPPSAEYAQLHVTLEAAQRAGVDAVRVGAAAQQVDRAARGVLRDAGLDQFFVHRTGHGIGLDEHEEPWIVEGNEQPLRAGMTFSVEPGVYVPGRHGARIEDIVAVTPGVAEPFNHRPHELTVI